MHGVEVCETWKPVGHDGQNASWTRDANATSLCVTANQPCVVSPSRSWPSFLGRYPPLSLSPRLRLALLLFLLLLRLCRVLPTPKIGCIGNWDNITSEIKMQ